MPLKLLSLSRLVRLFPSMLACRFRHKCDLLRCFPRKRRHSSAQRSSVRWLCHCIRHRLHRRHWVERVRGVRVVHMALECWPKACENWLDHGGPYFGQHLHTEVLPFNHVLRGSPFKSKYPSETGLQAQLATCLGSGRGEHKSIRQLQVRGSLVSTPLSLRTPCQSLLHLPFCLVEPGLFATGGNLQKSPIEPLAAFSPLSENHGSGSESWAWACVV